MKEQNSVQKQFLESYGELSEAIFRHCFFRVSDREVAVDLMQETFLKTWKHLQGGNDIYDIKAFLYKVTNNLIIDHYRKKKSVSLESLTEGEDSNFEPTDDSYQDITSKAEVNLIMGKIAELEEPYRQAVIMRYVDGLPPKEIAEIIGETANNVSVRIVRGLEQLREKIK